MATAGRRVSLSILMGSQVAAMSTWFATTAAMASIKAGWALSPFHEAALTSSVQVGFVLGTVISAVFSLSDRIDLRRLFSWSAGIACVANVAIPLFPPDHVAVPVLRLVTGICMAGVYPVGMKMAATWAVKDLGLLIGLLVGALTLGSAAPNLFAMFGGVDWRTPCFAAAACAAFASVLIRFAAIGPNLGRSPKFRPSNILLAWRNRPVRYANLGYLGHMWELYAMWAWIGAFAAASLAAGGHDPSSAALITFIIIGSGSLGALVGGWAADKWGRTAVTSLAMAVSGSCALLIGFTFGQAPVFLIVVGIVWGISIIADSAQFSAAVAELADHELVGTMLTIQTSAGFLLTLVSIHLLPVVEHALGWQRAFAILAIGPFFGILAMLKLRGFAESRRLAGGHR